MSKKKTALTALAAISVASMMTQRRLDLNRALPKIDDTKKNDIDNILILGSGGVMGVAWHAATLTRLERLGIWSPSDDDLRIGTSAGSMVAVALGAGFSPETILKVVTGEPVPHGESELRMPSMARNPASENEKSDKWYFLRALSKAKLPYPGVLMSSLLPLGTENMDELMALVDKFTEDSWPEVETWITSVEINKGSRHVFSHKSGVSPGFAVAASCSVPSLYRPMQYMEGTKFIDGGVVSGLHIDLAMGLKPKKITILAPLSGFVRVKLSDPWNVSMKKIGRNSQEVAIAKAQVKAKAHGIELIVIRPRPIENELLNRGSLMDSTLLPELVESTLKD